MVSLSLLRLAAPCRLAMLVRSEDLAAPSYFDNSGLLFVVLVPLGTNIRDAAFGFEFAMV